MRRRDFTAAALGAAVMANGPARAAEEAFPQRSIRLVVGFPPGQASDVGARVIAAKLGEDLGQAVFVDNKPGASGIIAHELVKTAPADGYTLMISSTAPLAINPFLYKKLPYDTLRDFTPITLINTSPMFLATGTASPFKNLRELIAYARTRPGKISYGSSGSGTTSHLAMEMLRREAGIDIVHVPYKGSPGMITDLIAGHIQLAFDASSSIVPQLAANKLRAIAVSGAERSPRFPDVPTVAEQGLPGFLALTWAGLLGPANLPPALVEKLNASVNRALRSKEVVEHYANAGSAINGGSAAGFDRFLREELKRWGPAVQASGAQVD